MTRGLDDASGHAWILESDRLFARHLDLASLRGRRHGKVRCVFHEETTGSLSVDLDRGLFHCFGCGAEGGVKRFAELVGKRPVTAAREVPRRHALDEARVAALATEQAAQRKREQARPLMAASDTVREVRRTVEAARMAATLAGPTEIAWELLEHAAAAERMAHAILAAVTP
jgi:CHC2 zinc finger